MALYRQELKGKQQKNKIKTSDFFITENDYDARPSLMQKSMTSRYSGSVLKYPTCNTSRVIFYPCHLNRCLGRRGKKLIN